MVWCVLISKFSTFVDKYRETLDGCQENGLKLCQNVLTKKAMECSFFKKYQNKGWLDKSKVPQMCL
jgi:hypothetical protein